MLSVYRYSSRILIQCHLTPTLKPEQHAPNRETIAKLALPLLLRLLEEHTETAVDAVAEVAPGTGVSTQRDKTDEKQATAAVERECDGEQEPAAAGEGGLVDIFSPTCFEISLCSRESSSSFLSSSSVFSIRLTTLSVPSTSCSASASAVVSAAPG